MVNVNLSGQTFNEEKFESFCKKYGLVFPKLYTDFLKKYNDSELDSNIIAGTEDLGIYIRYFYGTTNDDFSNIEEVYQSYFNRMPSKCIPIADSDFGNQICMSLQNENYGKIYFWNHETMDTDYEEKCKLAFGDMILLADSFESLLDKIVPFEVEVSTESESIFDKIKKIFSR